MVSIAAAEAIEEACQGGGGFLGGVGGLQAGEDAALKEAIIAATAVEFFAVVDEEAAGGAETFFTDALIEDTPERAADEFVGDLKDRGGDDQGAQDRAITSFVDTNQNRHALL